MAVGSPYLRNFNSGVISIMPGTKAGVAGRCSRLQGYYDGMIPLVLVGIMIVIIDLVGWRRF